jgi:CRISPR-associated protein Cas5a/b/c
MTSKYALLVEVIPHSPISVFVPFSSAAAESYLLPPPTTLVGALAYAYLRAQGSMQELRDGVSAAVKLLEKVDYAAAGVLDGYLLFRTIERIYQHPYLRSEHRSKVDMAYTVAPRAASFFNRLLLLYIVRDRDLAKHAYGIVRVGRKEGLVSVNNVVCEEVEKVVAPAAECYTTFYFPRRVASSFSGPHEIQLMPKLSRRNFEKRARSADEIEREEFVVPKPPGFSALSVELSEQGIVLKLRASTGTVEVPVPRSVVEG